MTFNEALKNKRKFLNSLSSYSRSLYHCVITPAKQEDCEKYMREFKKSPTSFIDESCKLYSTDLKFKVVVMPKEKQ